DYYCQSADSGSNQYIF
nr:immunoglobulin light chain junction region [Macaca mulatta]